MHEDLRRGVNDINRVVRFFSASDLADQGQRLANGPVRRNAHELGSHNPASCFRRVLEQLLERSARRVAHGREKSRPIIGWNFTKEIGLLISRHGFDQRPDFARLDFLDDCAAVSGQLGLVEDVHGQIERQRCHYLRCGLRRQLLQCFSNVRARNSPRASCSSSGSLWTR